MNIKTITCHDVYNFGASLQAYALQTFLEENGHNVEVIDYLPDYKQYYEFFKVYDKGFLGMLSKEIPLLEPLWAAIQHRSWCKIWPKILRFRKFKKRYLHCTKQTYKCIDDLKKNKPLADLYIAGSDQIWNTAFKNGLDPVYYCLFESNKEKCISYAASFGISSIPIEYQDFVRKGLSNFRALSIREEAGVKLAKSLGYDSVNVLDPVFLLSKEQWNTFFNHKNKKDKYLLIYDFAQNDECIKEIAIKIAKKRKLKIYSFITSGTYIDKVLNTCGPIEFLEWIANADMVISNSFHATAFSVIFERDFYTIPLRGYENSSRMKDFLNLLNLNDRYVSDVNLIDYCNSINYCCSSLLLQKQIESSKKWLLENLKNI